MVALMPQSEGVVRNDHHINTARTPHTSPTRPIINTARRMSDWFTQALGHPVVRIWSYRSTFFVFMTLFIGFSSVVPIDTISQASKSDNYALNTFVVVGALVLFGVTSAVIITTRLFVLRSSMADIPKRYVPIEPNDLPVGCSEMIEANAAKCEKVRARALQTPKEVKHPGLAGPDSELLPPLLKFDDAVRSIGLKLKWDRRFAGSDLELPKNMSFRESIAYIEEKLALTDPDLCREYVELYEELRYSGKLISEDQFVHFMELCIDFMKDIAMGREGGPSADRFRYTASIISRYSDDPSRPDSLRNRTHQQRESTSSQLPLAQTSPSKALYSNELGEFDDSTVPGSYNEALKRVNTGQSYASFKTVGTTSYNPYYDNS